MENIICNNSTKYKDCCNDVLTTENSILYVIAVVSNPAMYARRYQLFNEFCERINKENQVKLITVELQQGCRPFVTNSTIKLRTEHEIWHKENLINIGVRHLPANWKYMAWIDSDLEFQNKNWVKDTIEQLQCYSVVQLFSHAIDLGYKNETLQVHTGFGYQYVNGVEWKDPKYGGVFHHPGYAWAITRDAYDNIGGLIEFAILGSADNHMALAFIGKVDCTINRNLNHHYKLLCKIFQERCEKFIKRNIGYVNGTILHYFHSCKKNRKYVERWQILVENDFDPLRDIIKDSSDLWRLEGSKYKLRDDIKLYFRQRNEDSIDLTIDYRYTKSIWV
jgi:hypothetical protein